MFRDGLSEGDQEASLQSHLPVILDPKTKVIISLRLRIGCDRTHAKAEFWKTKYSIQLRPKAIILETTMVTAMNFIVSTVPHSRSK